MAWYVVVDNQRLGPFSTRDVREHLRNGRFSLNAQVMRQGSSVIRRLVDVPEFGGYRNKQQQCSPVNMFPDNDATSTPTRETMKMEFGQIPNFDKLNAPLDSLTKATCIWDGLVAPQLPGSPTEIELNFEKIAMPARHELAQKIHRPQAFGLNPNYASSCAYRRHKSHHLAGTHVLVRALAFIIFVLGLGFMISKILGRL